MIYAQSLCSAYSQHSLPLSQMLITLNFVFTVINPRRESVLGLPRSAQVPSQISCAPQAYAGRFRISVCLS